MTIADGANETSLFWVPPVTLQVDYYAFEITASNFRRSYSSRFLLQASDIVSSLPLGVNMGPATNSSVQPTPESNIEPHVSLLGTRVTPSKITCYIAKANLHEASTVVT
ncbi:hypothetical protein CONLIGDRAFT_710922 [Coniochaeta ligniaria NRRL 30616]|uniref:Uncharacterized protein n=1 Tax=Coniochaeta ligniaria NRRL 30616 TaxID=1408157 RepID=A0A1J7J0I7_9PEZI|nr:hypothetical protein CONLIGDRAFT_710922 [Coniochaeta ligniaria NRRL 30616]